MKLLCRAFGHTFGESAVEQRREERPKGTFLVVREYWTCRRCGIEEDIYTNRGLISTDPLDCGANPVDGTVPSPPAVDNPALTETRDRLDGLRSGPAAQNASRNDKSCETAQSTSSYGSGAATLDGLPEKAAEESSPVMDNAPAKGSDGGPTEEGVEILQGTSRDGRHPQFTRGVPDDTGSDQAGAGNRHHPAMDSSPETPGADSESAPSHRCENCGVAIPVASSPYMAGDICAACGRGYIARIGEESASDWEDHNAARSS